MRLLFIFFAFCFGTGLAAQVPGGTREQKDSIQVAREILRLADSKHQLEERIKLLEASQENKIKLLLLIRQKERETDSSLQELKKGILLMEAEKSTKELRKNIAASKKLTIEIEKSLESKNEELVKIENDMSKTQDLMVKARSLLSRLIVEIDELQKKIQ
jgi:hypothetical protein